MFSEAALAPANFLITKRIHILSKRWMDVFRPDGQTYSAQCLKGSSVVLYCRGLHRECVHCSAGCLSDCRGSACGCGRRYGDDTTFFSRLQCPNPAVVASVRSVHATTQMLTCVLYEGLCLHHPLRTMTQGEKRDGWPHIFQGWERCCPLACWC